MQYIQRYGRAMTIAVGFFLGAAGAQPVFALGTPMGTPVDNNVTMDFSVNGIGQSTATSTQFTVDEKLVVNVVAGDTDWVTAAPGQLIATGSSGIPAMNFTVTNSSNAPKEVVVGLVGQGTIAVNGFGTQSGGALAPTPVGPPVPNPGLVVAIDSNANQAFDDGGDVEIPAIAGSYYDLGTMAPDETISLVISANLPGAAPGDYAAYTLVAAVATGTTAEDEDDSGNPAPWNLTPSPAAPNTILGVESVFADLNAASVQTEDVQFDFLNGAPILSQDTDSNGQTSDTSGLVVGSTVALAKYVEVIYDPVSGNRYSAGAAVADPKAIPGAVMMYVIGLINDSAALQATGLAVQDDLPDGPELVDEGDQSGAAAPIELPADVSFAVGSANPVFPLAAVSDLNDIYAVDCSGTPIPDLSAEYDSDVVFGAADTATVNPEFSVTIGDCDPNETAYLVYFVTVN